MRYGLLYLNELKYDDLAWVFVKNGYDAEIIDTGISVDSIKPEDAEKVSDQLKQNGIDIAITMDFCPAVSDACQDCDIPYIAWINDAPQQALYNRQITNSNTHIFSFDAGQVKELQVMGARDVVHFPLATNVYRNSGLVISEDDQNRYECDVSFIGSLYVDDFYDKVYGLASDNTRKEMDSILKDSVGIWDGTDRLAGRLSKEAMDDLQKICHFTYDSDNPFALGVDKYLVSRLFARKLTHLERIEAAQMLSGRDFRLYTSSKDFEIEGVDLWPALSYDEELPKAYHLSKINLNITLHSITSGIPLRVFDIMGVGGLVLSNYQPEIEEFFTIGKDIEVYRSLDEMVDKVDYYLTHEKSRNFIALNGYKTVSEKYSYDVAFQKMMEHINVKL